MRVYNINKAVGLASSGVEYAQRYRRELLAGIPWVDDRYVFTDYVGTNLSFFTSLLGFADEQVVWIYNLVAGRRSQPSTLTVDGFLASVAQPHAAPQQTPDSIDVALTDSAVRYRLRMLRGGVVDRVETVVGDQLIRVEHYDATLNNVEHFHENRLMRRAFYAPDGRIAAEQFYRGQEITRTVITPASPLYAAPGSYAGDLIVEGRSRFFQLVFDHLLSEPDDVVIVDRALDVIDGIYPVLGDHRLYSVVHAEHYDLKQVDDGVLLWNNHYEHVFTRPDLVDGFVVSTRRQKEVLEGQLAARLPEGDFSVTAIPVGVAAEPTAAPGYDSVALVTASRLADEKHIDWLIRAVDQARQVVPGLRLDIYGEGQREPLLAVIKETGTEDCVRLMGHHELAGVLGTYALYVSASTSEGFGLSLLEAIAEGLPIVGFDVDYGNREMVEPGVNGRLVPFTNSARDIDQLAAAIVETLTSETLEDMRRHSLKRAEAYTAANVQRHWERLLRGQQPC